MLAFPPKTTMAVAVGAGALLLLTGCSSKTKSSSTPSAGKSSPSPAASPSSAAGPATTVTATETEFKITLSQSSFKAGTYTFKAVNQGKFPHNLAIAGPGVAFKASPIAKGGGSGALTVTLQAGSYELWCAVDSHKAKGMDMKITVA